MAGHRFVRTHRSRVHVAAVVVLVAISIGLLPTMIHSTWALDADETTHPGCLERAATWANVHPTLLRAIAWVESRGNAQALNWNRNGSYDVGLMQINSWWYARGLRPWWHALGQPCVNVAAGAWVLRQCTEAYRYTWNAVGCYHAGQGWERGQKRAIGQRYIRRVHQTLKSYTGPR